MERLVRFTKSGEETELFFNCCFPNVIKIVLQKADTDRLGDLLQAFGKKRGGSFTWNAGVGARWGSFVFKIRASFDRKRKVPVLELEYTKLNERFETVSDCYNRYDSFSFEGALQFGLELKELEDGKCATLYACPPLSVNPFDN